jgi:hypothetical protein
VTLIAVAAEREFEFYGDDGAHPAVARAYVPYFDRRPLEKPWTCKFEISWPGYEERRVVFGADSWAALFAASAVVSRLIADSPAFKAGRIGANGQRLRAVEQIEQLFGLVRSEQ